MSACVLGQPPVLLVGCLGGLGSLKPHAVRLLRRVHEALLRVHQRLLLFGRFAAGCPGAGQRAACNDKGCQSTEGGHNAGERCYHCPGVRRPVGCGEFHAPSRLGRAEPRCQGLSEPSTRDGKPSPGQER
jgi:hypothetical protein